MAQENDIILIYYEGQPVSFARIESILPDVKKDWYHVKLLLLQVPLQTVTWILRDVYINGEEFTMGGNRMRLEKVEAPAEPDADTLEQEEKTEDAGEGASKEQGGKQEAREEKKDAKVLSLFDRPPRKDSEDPKKDE
jgi:hypothetical protein